ncbi:MAG: hypothetical protein JXA30_04855 [Deltaproteobacteria bacterium]|nr:hypothetical protein [Deltaproteobacteria bacterium]
MKIGKAVVLFGEMIICCSGCVDDPASVHREGPEAGYLVSDAGFRDVKGLEAGHFVSDAGSGQRNEPEAGGLVSDTGSAEKLESEAGDLVSEAASADRKGPEAGASVSDAGSGEKERSQTDVCGFTAPVSLGEVEADGMVLVPPNHPDILYFGRIDCSTPLAPSFAFPGVSIRVAFNGDAIDIVFTDHGNANSPNYYNVIIDAGEPEVLEMIPGRNVYTLAENLSTGVHTVELFKRVESNQDEGRGEFQGFRIPEGASVMPLSPKPYRLEVIGDSITCGYGNEVSVLDPTNYHYTTENSNAYNAWGAIAARNLDAEYVAVAYSGRGVYRNYGGEDRETVPEMYLDALPDNLSAAPWDVSRFVPDIVVINLGTNDFSPELETAEINAATKEFEMSYLEFAETLRSYYSEATFVLAVGPMLSDSYPPGYQALSNVTDSLEAVIAARKAVGDDGFYLLEIPEQLAPYGEDWHPTVTTHEAMAERLVDFIDRLDLL